MTTLPRVKSVSTTLNYGMRVTCARYTQALNRGSIELANDIKSNTEDFNMMGRYLGIINPDTPLKFLLRKYINFHILSHPDDLNPVYKAKLKEHVKLCLTEYKDKFNPHEIMTQYKSHQMYLTNPDCSLDETLFNYAIYFGDIWLLQLLFDLYGDSLLLMYDKNALYKR